MPMKNNPVVLAKIAQRLQLAIIGNDKPKQCQGIDVALRRDDDSDFDLDVTIFSGCKKLTHGNLSLTIRDKDSLKHVKHFEELVTGYIEGKISIEEFIKQSNTLFV